jgi:hypothetical protein
VRFAPVTFRDYFYTSAEVSTVGDQASGCVRPDGSGTVSVDADEKLGSCWTEICQVTP